MRKYLAFLLLGILTLVGAGGAAVGAVQAQSGTAIGQAVKNTLGASNYTENLVEKTPQGNQTAHLVYQAPDRLGGWLLSAGRKTYLFIIGTTEYIAVSQSASAPMPTTFYTQQTTGAQAVDPAHTYLPYYDCNPQAGAPPRKCPTTRNGNVTTVTLTQGSQKETLTFTVTGNYVSEFNAVTPGGTINLGISDLGSSPAVELPQGYKTTTRAPTQG
jgi:hypothetical protein